MFARKKGGRLGLRHLMGRDVISQLDIQNVGPGYFNFNGVSIVRDGCHYCWVAGVACGMRAKGCDDHVLTRGFELCR